MRALNPLAAPAVLVLVVIYWSCVSVNGDIAADRKECTQVVTTLAPCLNYVMGNGGVGSPTPDCCRATTILLSTNVKCLCVLLNDRNSLPELSSFNITTAIRLPYLCRGSVNATHCIDLLQLPANSSGAQYFRELSKTIATFPAPPAASGSAAPAGGSGSATSGWNEPKGFRSLVGGISVLLLMWSCCCCLLVITMTIWN